MLVPGHSLGERRKDTTAQADKEMLVPAERASCWPLGLGVLTCSMFPALGLGPGAGVRREGRKCWSAWVHMALERLQPLDLGLGGWTLGGETSRDLRGPAALVSSTSC